MTEDEIRQKIGLSDNDLRDFLKKFDAFARSLNSAQRRVLQNSMASEDEAARSLTDEATPEELESFIRKRAPAAGATVCWMVGGKKSRK